jgi:hypothetical protein
LLREETGEEKDIFHNLVSTFQPPPPPPIVPGSLPYTVYKTLRVQQILKLFINYVRSLIILCMYST